MAIRNVVLKSDEVLRKRCKKIEKFDKKLEDLLDDLADTLYKTGGVGLAAPQVGILRTVAVIDIGDGLVELVNPEIVKTSGTQRDIEGCLSCPNEWGYVTRPRIVTVEYYNRAGEKLTLKAKDFFARAVCHETDHLKGQLFLDIVDEMVDPKDLKD